MRYDPVVHPPLIERLLKLGLDPDEVAKAVGIPLWKLNQWIEQFPEVARVRAKIDQKDCEVVDSLYDQAIGYIDDKGRRKGASVVAAIYLTKVRLRWNDKPELDKPPPGGDNLGKLSLADLTSGLAQVLEEIKRRQAVASGNVAAFDAPEQQTDGDRPSSDEESGLPDF